jgi:hypothetical protein
MLLFSAKEPLIVRVGEKHSSLFLAQRKLESIQLEKAPGVSTVPSFENRLPKKTINKNIDFRSS